MILPLNASPPMAIWHKPIFPPPARSPAGMAMVLSPLRRATFAQYKLDTWCDAVGGNTAAAFPSGMINPGLWERFAQSFNDTNRGFLTGPRIDSLNGP